MFACMLLITGAFVYDRLCAPTRDRVMQFADDGAELTDSSRKLGHRETIVEVMVT